MTARYKLPIHNAFKYTLNSETGLYQLVDFPLSKILLPITFKIEETQKRDIVDAKYIIRGKREKWEDKILTGLRCITANWYYGDTIRNKKKSYLIIHISENNLEVTIYMFKGFYPSTPVYRTNLNNDFINSLK